MNCKKMEEVLVDLIYDEVSKKDEELAKYHLLSCRSCAKKYSKLKETTTALARWTEEQPEMNLLFIEEKVPLIERLMGKLDQFGITPQRFVLGAFASIFILVLFMGIMRTDAAYHNGKWEITFGDKEKRDEFRNENAVLSEFKKLQQENLVLMNTILLNSERRLREENMNSVSILANEFANQRQQDLFLIGNSINKLAQRNQDRQVQTNQLLNELYRLSSFRPNGQGSSRKIEGN